MQTSATIIAIDKDDEAPVFELVDLGVVGDLHAVLPAAAEQVNQRTARSTTSASADYAVLGTKRMDSAMSRSSALIGAGVPG